MRRPTRLGLAAPALVAALGCQPAVPDVPAALEPVEAAAVRGLLAARPGWRLTTAADNAAPGLDEVRRREPGYEPYVRRWDWDRDGRRDFAVVLRRDTAYAVYWFRGDTGGRYGPAAEVASAGWLREGALLDRDGGLVLAPSASDEFWVFRWDASRRQLRLVDPDTSE